MDFSEQLFAKFSGYRLYCGFSGGADSTAALLLAKKFQKNYSYELYAVHFNHHLRGAESDREAAEAALTARNMEIDFQCIDLEINNKENLESSARQARIDAWKKLLPPRSAVILGHHADDRRENLLIRLCRGSNSWGLSSMRAISEVEGITFIRPLLQMTRRDIEEFLRANHVDTWAMDSSNSGTEFLRNFFRNSFFPELARRFPAAIKGMERSLNALETDADFINCYVRDLPGNRNSIEFWKQQHDAVKIRLLRELTGVIPNRELLNRVNEEIKHTSGELRQIPVNNETAIFLRNDLIEVRRFQSNTKIPDEFLWEWKKTPVLHIGKWHFTASLVKSTCPCGPECAFFDAGLLPEQLAIGAIRPGEKMLPFGSDREKKIKKLRTDRRIPADRLLPAVRSSDVVYWVPVIRNSEHAKVTEKTVSTVKFEFKESDI
ncbi:MAG: tRNA lysidine(34) synthetase TilS [Lentisphaeria bacterium]|nr:tRNA lysidine(34) synthetase TilS [Lentisphaeria bacterium]